MKIELALAETVQALIDAHPGMNENALSVISGMPKTTVRRMRLGEVAAQIDSVEKVAKAFQLRTCDILDPDLIRRLRAGEPLRMAEPRPPVMTEDQWRALSPRTRAFVEDLCQQAAAGAVTDADIGWLHDGLNRAARPTPPEITTAPAVTGIAAEVLSKKLTTESAEIRPGRVKS